MKKYLVLLLTVMMMGVLTATASAGALGVNVPPGYVLEVDSVLTPVANYYYPSFIAGLNDKAALGVMYDTSANYFTVSGRYCLVKNVAADLFYRLDGSNSWISDLRAKYFLNQRLALAGKYSYDSLFSNHTIIGQAEYLFNENWMGNAGFIYSNSTTFFELGADFATLNMAVGLNCVFPANDFSKPGLEVVVDYFIKR
jgi:hypothetical protein